MLVKSIEKKIKTDKTISIVVIAFAIIISIGSFIFSYKIIEDSRKSIYILDNGIPILVKQSDELLNRPVEYKSQIELFHRLFFTLPPDNEYIKENIEKSLYLIDESGKKEYTNLKETGFYNQIVSSNATVIIKPDSININLENKYFKFFGRQIINRKNSVITRILITEGNFDNITRTPNNPHGVMLKNWRILDNTELSSRDKF